MLPRMMTSALAWSAVLLYAAIAGALAWRASRRTDDLDSYAVGSRDLPAALVGLALTAQLTSVATFVINPGLVFHFGLSALLGYGAAAGLGITLGLIVFTGRFRRVGASVAALTLPQWLGARFGSPALRGGFAALSLGLVAYAVLIVVALALVLSGLLGVPAVAVAAALTALAVATVALGGANGHAWTGAIQALVMLGVAVLLIAAGLPSIFDGSLKETLVAANPALMGITNPGSPWFRNLFEVFVCNFVVGGALVCQPHIVSKALFLKDDRQVRTYLATAVVAGTVFLGVLVVGLYARAVVPAATPIDQVVPTWIALQFPATVQIGIAIGLLCAGLSTLEGILLALASILSVDVHPAWRRHTGASPTAALAFGRRGLIAIGIVTAALAAYQLAHPTAGSVAIFAQYGVYLLFTAAFVPLLGGMFLRMDGAAALAAAGAAVATYLGLAIFDLGPMTNNPAYLATCGIGAGGAAAAMVAAARKIRATTPDAGAYPAAS